MRSLLLLVGVLTACSGSTSMTTVNATAFAGTTWTFVVGPNAMQSESPGILVGSLPTHVGDVLDSMRLQIRGRGHLTAVAKITDASMSERVIGTARIDARESWAPATVKLGDARVPRDGALTMIFTADSAGVSLGNIGVVYTPGS